MNTIDLRDLISQLIASPVETTKELINLMVPNLAHHWPLILLATITFFAIRALLQKAKQKTMPTGKRRMDRKRERAWARRSLFSSIGIALLWAAYGAIVAGQLGISVSGSTAGWLIGVFGIVLAIAAQQLVQDLMAGWHIIASDQFGVGDFVDVGFNFSGTVISVGLRTTRLKAEDGSVVHLRHSNVWKVMNRTQGAGRLLIDVVCSPLDEHPVSPDDLDRWEKATVDSLVGLRRTLRGVADVEMRKSPTEVSVSEVAQVVPLLIPSLSHETLTDMRAVATADISPAEDGTDILQKALDRASVETPVLKEIEPLGLVSAEVSTATLRFRVRLLDGANRTYAASLVRRRIFDALWAHGVSAGFMDPPNGTVIN